MSDFINNSNDCSVVLGSMRGKTAGGRDFTRIYISSVFDNYMREKYVCTGSCVQDVYCPFVVPDVCLRPGATVKFSWKPGYQGKAVVSNVEIVK